ncbi:PREDICTED: glycine cleavage system H protein-like [Priapulus caudatus]|uniref:Glycine cleavage system H protein n=1 Tax=Priapulus caudatus TaxID=37621 RepID=A0ABM1F7M6_PRICU|nr:PREDICTED: glycine cleavage system H protein-like [Priapulus caudatus]
MSEVPSELKYAKSHEWVRIEDDGMMTVGISDHAQALLGDLVFVELPEVGTELSAGDECCVVESVKAASDVYMPISGEIMEINEALADEPEIINSAPYDNGWLFKVQPSAGEVEDLLDAEAYQAELDE